MIGTTISHYRITERLGEGAGGVVYKAEDITLHRTVALKFLKNDPLLRASDRELLLKEARSIAPLDHPNICTIFEVIEEGEFICFAMALAHGVPLKDLVRSGPLDPAEAVRIASEIASGLQAAHDRGVIHRDIKSANIMVSETGGVKIMDFGIAVKPDMIDSDPQVSVGGTAAYMSPEQCRGDEVDARTDIWSLGVCLYEMLSGKLPYEGAYSQAVIYSILNEEPRSIRELAPDVHPGVAGIVEKAMKKDPDRRYQNLNAMLLDLRRFGGPASRESPAAGSSPAELTHPSIAVLPFVDMSPQRDQGYFCDGIAEEIINAFNQIEHFYVAARTSSFAYKDSPATVGEIGSNLGVATLLEGSVRKSGDQLRITVTLTDVAADRHLWSKRFDRKLADIFAIQDEIAENIVNTLKISLSEKERGLLAKTTTRNFQAYDYYLQGRQSYQQTTRRGILHALELYGRAIENDPRYALAYAGMSECFSFLYSFFDNDPSNLEQAMALSNKSLALDPELAEARVARGRAYSHNRQYGKAESEFELAITLNPGLYAAFEAYARNCYSQGDYEKAAALYRQAMTIDPDNFNAPLLLHQTCQGMGDYEQSRSMLDRGLENARKHLMLRPDDSRALYMYAIALANAGDKDKAESLIERALSIDPEDNMVLYGAACVYSRTGKEEQAIDALERSLARGCFHKDWVEKDSDFDPIRHNPRFQSLLGRLE